MGTSAWTDERVETLKIMLAKGYSFGIIAETLGGVSRNGVIGKARRMGLVCVNKTGRWGPLNLLRVRPPRMEGKTMIAIVPASPPLTLENGAHVTMLDLTARMCRWPIGDPQDQDFHFCGHKPLAGRVYCPYHHGIAFQKGSAKRA